MSEVSWSLSSIIKRKPGADCFFLIRKQLVGSSCCLFLLYCGGAHGLFGYFGATQLLCVLAAIFVAFSPSLGENSLREISESPCSVLTTDIIHGHQYTIILSGCLEIGISLFIFVSGVECVLIL